MERVKKRLLLRKEESSLLNLEYISLIRAFSTCKNNEKGGLPPDLTALSPVAPSVLLMDCFEGPISGQLGFEARVSLKKGVTNYHTRNKKVLFCVRLKRALKDTAGLLFGGRLF